MTGRPVQFEITEQTRTAIGDWVTYLGAGNGRYLFPSRFREQPHLSTRQYARIVHQWVERAGLDNSAYGTHSTRRTKPAQIYKKTGNLRAVQLLLGTRSCRAPFAISGSRRMTLSASRWGSRFRRIGRCGPTERRDRSAESLSLLPRTRLLRPGPPPPTAVTNGRDHGVAGDARRPLGACSARGIPPKTLGQCEQN